MVDICGNISIKINGNFFSSGDAIPVVTIGDKKCKYISHDKTTITCLTPDSEPASKKVLVHVPGVGTSKITNNLTYRLKLLGFFPRCGSIVGGTEVTVHGRRFCGNVNNTKIRICGVDCHVTSVESSTDLKCVTQGTRKTVYVGNGGTHKSKKAFSILRSHFEILEFNKDFFRDICQSFLSSILKKIGVWTIPPETFNIQI